MSKETYKLLKRKKRKGLDLFYERYAKKLFNYAKQNWQCNDDIAWDIIYQSFDKIIENIDKYEFESEAKFGSFVLVTFLNNLRNHYRDSQKNIQMVYVDEDDSLSNLPEEEDSTPIDSALMLQLKSELQQLEEWERMLLLLRAQRMSYNEIAKYVDKPEQQLKVYYQRLKNRLIKKIKVNEEVQHG